MIEISAFSPEVKAAIIQAAITLLAAALGAYAIVIQIQKQAIHALQQQRTAERHRINLALYEQCLSVMDTCYRARSDLEGFIVEFQWALTRAEAQNAAGMEITPPDARTHVLIARNYNLGREIANVIKVIESWEVADLRLSIFRLAFHAWHHEIINSFHSYFEFVLRCIAHDKPSNPGQIFPWSIPTSEDIAQLKEHGANLMHALGKMDCSLHDLRVELQNLLVGPLFENRVPSRNSTDTSSIVISLARHEEIDRFFRNETAWGKYIRSL